MDKIKLKFDFRLISKDNEKIRNKKGMYFLSKKFKDFEDRIQTSATLQYFDQILECDLELTLAAFFTSKTHSDATNLFKGVCDALQGVIYKNDRQIKIATVVVKDEKAAKDYFEVCIYPIV